MCALESLDVYFRDCVVAVRRIGIQAVVNALLDKSELSVLSFGANDVGVEGG